jgi:hypothetical protein
MMLHLAAQRGAPYVRTLCVRFDDHVALASWSYMIEGLHPYQRGRSPYYRTEGNGTDLSDRPFQTSPGVNGWAWRVQFQARTVSAPLPRMALWCIPLIQVCLHSRSLDLAARQRSRAHIMAHA